MCYTGFEGELNAGATAQVMLVLIVMLILNALMIIDYAYADTGYTGFEGELDAGATAQVVRMLFYLADAEYADADYADAFDCAGAAAHELLLC